MDFTKGAFIDVCIVIEPSVCADRPEAGLPLVALRSLDMQGSIARFVASAVESSLEKGRRVQKRPLNSTRPADYNIVLGGDQRERDGEASGPPDSGLKRPDYNGPNGKSEFPVTN